MTAPHPGSSLMSGEQGWAAGDLVVWPNGTIGEVCGVDFSDGTLLRDDGSWHAIYDVERIASHKPHLINSAQPHKPDLISQVSA